MFYLGQISYIDPYKDEDYESRCESMVVITLLVEASDADSALEKMRDKLIVLHEEDEKYGDVDEFFLDDLVEMEYIGTQAKVVSWTSIIPFGKSLAKLNYYSDDDLTVRHYALRKSSMPSAKTIMNANVELMAIDEEDGEGENTPLLSIDRDRKRIKPLYKKLRKRKFQGLLPDFKELSDGDLYELYVVEGCLSSEIADLFDISKSRVDYRRRKIGATISEEVPYDVLKAFEVITPIPYEERDDETA